ncbi:LpxL/LpxP family Kdo(2)-lipid IV(A) lauroyl/palmitoleoyl acyltransferase [Ectothiorhodospiraceae bacterium WFHF3C12]|nr:LpxL/LpxP family Kdo(2)-lipid IV(A) lauroyl/palmitoleoyl acyltransferase [Ectothiorhodospiraceae bacterium WFHF3C12]
MARHEKTLPQNLAHPRHWGQWLTLGLLWLLARLPHRAALRVGEWLGLLAHRLWGSRRRVVERNLALCFPDMDPAERAALRKRNFRFLGRGIAELALSWYGGPAVDRIPLHVKGVENLEAARAGGRPVILLSGHFMSVELAARLIGWQVRLGAMYKPMKKRPVFDRALLRGRSRTLPAILPRDDVRGIVRALRSGIPMWYAGDQDYGRRHSVFVPFFGVPAATITALTRLARMSGAAVVPLQFYADTRDGSYRVVFEPAWTDFPSGDEAADARRMNEFIERAVRAHPEQYLWIHRRFKRQPDPATYLYPD